MEKNYKMRISIHDNNIKIIITFNKMIRVDGTEYKLLLYVWSHGFYGFDGNDALFDYCFYIDYVNYKEAFDTMPKTYNFNGDKEYITLQYDECFINKTKSPTIDKALIIFSQPEYGILLITIKSLFFANLGL